MLHKLCLSQRLMYEIAQIKERVDNSTRSFDFVSEESGVCCCSFLV